MHWGKLFDAAEFGGGGCREASFPGLGRFRELCAARDPAGKFRTAFLDRLLLFDETSK